MNKKKLIAPIIITIIVLLYYLGFAYLCITLRELPLLIKILGGIIPLIFAGVFIAVFIERINEIKRGEDDDLSNY